MHLLYLKYFKDTEYVKANTHLFSDLGTHSNLFIFRW